MNTRYGQWFVLVAMVVTLAVAAVVQCRRHRTVRPVTTREEIVVAGNLLAERQLGPEVVRGGYLLIDRLTESQPYRLAGGKRVNQPRLNLSLDSLGK